MGLHALVESGNDFPGVVGEVTAETVTPAPAVVVMWDLPGYGTVPEVSGMTPEELGELVSAGLKFGQLTRSAQARVSRYSERFVAARELVYLRTGVTSELFGKRNPGRSEAYAAVVGPFARALTKQTSSSAKAALQARWNVLLAAFGQLVMTDPAPVGPDDDDDTGPGEPEATDPHAVLAQHAANYAASLRVCAAIADDTRETSPVQYGLTRDSIRAAMLSVSDAEGVALRAIGAFDGPSAQ